MEWCTKMKRIVSLLALLLFFCGVASAQCTPAPIPAGQHGTSLCFGASPSTGVTAYNIYRATGACTSTTLTWTKIGSTLPTVLNYIDLTPTLGTTYCYSFTAMVGTVESDRTLSATLQIIYNAPIVTPAKPAPPSPPGAPSGVGN
jgi:hypothetical protein